MIVSDFPSLSVVVAGVWTQVDPSGPKLTQVDPGGTRWTQVGQSDPGGPRLTQVDPSGSGQIGLQLGFGLVRGARFLHRRHFWASVLLTDPNRRTILGQNLFKTRVCAALHATES